MTLALRYTVRSDVGLLREGNEDSAYAGPHLLAIADGMGGHAAGEVASAVAISTLAPLDADTTGLDMLQALADAVTDANATLNQITLSDPATEGMGTTLTALLWSGEDVAICHIGDSRAYLLRDGSFAQITRDHTLVQSLVDEGRITAEAAASHPQRSLVMRALQSSIPAEPDLEMLRAHVGDRYLLCSDGLSDVVSDETLAKTLTDLADLDEAVERLVDLAIRSGGPDNITCVLADVIDPSTGQAPTEDVCVAGAVVADQGTEPVRGDSPAARAHLLARGIMPPPAGQAQAGGAETERPAHSNGGDGGDDSDDSDGSDRGDGSDDSDDSAAPSDVRPLAPALAGRRRWPVVTTVLAVLVAVVGGSGYYGWKVTQSEYYVGVSNGRVAVFRGVNQAVAGMSLSSMVQQTDIPLSAVPPVEARQIMATLPPGTLAQAQRTIAQIKKDYQCAVAQTAIRVWMAHRPPAAPRHRHVAKRTAAKHLTSKRTAGPTRSSQRSAAGGASSRPAASQRGHHATSSPRPVLPVFCSAPSGGSE